MSISFSLAINGNPPAARFVVETLPRIGEHVQFGNHVLKVTDIVHDLKGHGTEITIHAK